MAKKKGKKASALDLQLEGSIGEFRIVNRAMVTDGSDTVPVKFLETHASFSLDGAIQERFLSHLMPVREILKIERLSFDEIMQRDIDDSRVASELIPYLLGRTTGSTVRFFPPIIVVVIPVGQDETPDEYYPTVTDNEVLDDDGDTWRYLRSGEVGSEAFEFRQLVEENVRLQHNHSQLWLNTTRCKLVIVDGQHRAMALLALYRNMKSWPERTENMKPYYERWSPEVLASYDLSQVQLPVVLCTFPGLDSPSAPLTITQACREIFLALNKNARPVTTARNYLLDDRDIVAAALRTMLNRIKMGSGEQLKNLRLWNIQLDSSKDKHVISSPAAFSGVMHLFKLAEIMMMYPEDISGVSASTKKLHKSTALDTALSRLELEDTFTATDQSSMRRRTLTPSQSSQFLEQFDCRIAGSTVSILRDFAPYAAHSAACVQLEARLSGSPAGSTAHAVLFGGHGASKVFDDHLKRLEQEVAKYKEIGMEVPATLETTLQRFQARKEGLLQERQELYRRRAAIWLGDCGETFAENSVSLANQVFSAVTTSAFQVGMVTAFFSVTQSLFGHLPKSPQSELYRKDYLAALNTFFGCSLGKGDQSKRGFRDLVNVLVGKARLNGNSVVLTNEHVSLKRVLVQGELKPDWWPVYRYLCLELWAKYTKKQDVTDILRSELVTSRVRIRTRYRGRLVRNRCKEKGILDSQLPKRERREVHSIADKAYAKGLASLLSCKLGDISLEEPLDPSQSPVSNDEPHTTATSI